MSSLSSHTNALCTAIQSLTMILKVRYGMAFASIQYCTRYGMHTYSCTGIRI